MRTLRIGTTKLIVPNLAILPYRWVQGVKQFRLIAEPVDQTLIRGDDPGMGLQRFNSGSGDGCESRRAC